MGIGAAGWIARDSAAVRWRNDADARAADEVETAGQRGAACAAKASWIPDRAAK